MGLVLKSGITHVEVIARSFMEQALLTLGGLLYAHGQVDPVAKHTVLSRWELPNLVGL
jgi:hypothetical protein